MIDLAKAEKMYLDGKSLASIGFRFGGVSRQRVLQLLQAHGVQLRGHIKRDPPPVQCAGCEKMLPYVRTESGGAFYRKWCSKECALRTRQAERDSRFPAFIKPTPECWIWKGPSMAKSGYGVFNNTYAHRESWRIFVGPIPHGKWVLHTCDNPRCVRPSHLWLGTAADNSADRDEKQRTKIAWLRPETRARCVTSRTAKTGKDPQLKAHNSRESARHAALLKAARSRKEAR